ncbi:ATP-binding protein [Cognatiyoonia koreensis]|nr:ATP-binding protein [Cognatiyoonia koreensis]
MFFSWLKQYMPRGLYMRAALILILPVLTLQLLVSVVFIQRHFEGVTRQMTSAVSIDLRFVRDTVNAAPTLTAAQRVAAELAVALELDVAWPVAIPDIGNDKHWTDLTGNAVRTRLETLVSDIGAVSLAERRLVTVWLQTDKGPLEVSFDRRRVSASNPHQLLVIMAVMGAIMTAIAYFFLRNQLRPIKRMAAAAQAYGKGRIANYTPGGAQEVRAAGTAFLDMRNRLERQAQTRTMMLSGVSHDLRTPLTRLRLGLSMLDNTDGAPLIRDVDEMQHLVDAFLDFAQADATDEPDLISPHDLLKQVVKDCIRGGMSVEIAKHEGPDEPVPLRSLAIRRALENLIGNAVRYGTMARASCYVTDRAVRYVVEDDGPGIPPEQRENATRPFVRLDPSRNQDRGSGVGLGLAIVNDIARSHGGILRLGESKELGGLQAELVLAKS